MVKPKPQVLLDSVRKLTRRQATGPLTNILNKSHPADIAEVIKYLTDSEKKQVFGLISDPEKAADVLSELDISDSLHLLEGMTEEQISTILNEMSSDDAAELISNLPEEISTRVLQLMEHEDQKDVEDLLQYEEKTAGRIMTTEFFALHEDTTADEAMKAIRENSEAEMVFYIYVVDERNHLVGVVSLRQLVVVSPKTKLKDIMTTDVISVSTDTDQEEVARIVERYNFLAIPVVDEKNHLMGIITVDDVIDVLREEATEDIMKMVGTKEEEFVYHDKVTRVARLRLPWLITNLFGGLVTGYLLWLFKVTIKDMLALITFVPVITGMGGNVGVQSSSIMVRGFATGKVNFGRVKQFLLREIMIGLLMGTICGIVVGLVGYIWHHSFVLGLVVGIAMMAAMTVAATMGTLVPTFFRKIHVDPAIASGPFVTTSNDIVGILIYLGTATLILRYFNLI
ncbi:MAG: magnesium transporter [Deltaproteobacteria bacterium]|nr:magnesium transporter [Deltaproteobacteria bacterium]